MKILTKKIHQYQKLNPPIILRVYKDDNISKSMKIIFLEKRYIHWKL